VVKFVVQELKRQGYWVRVLSRNSKKIELAKQYVDEMILGEVTKPETIKGLCKNIDIVFSSLGITRQKDALPMWMLIIRRMEMSLMRPSWKMLRGSCIFPY
jgi:glutamyl-tRNA reductase